MKRKSVVASFQFSIVSILFVLMVIALSRFVETAWVNISQEDNFTDQLEPLPSPPTLASPAVLFPTSTESAVINTATDSVYLVEKVIDGDTIRLATGQTVRYIGMDTPETSHPRLGKQCFGEEAAKANADLVSGKYVSLEKDVSETDRYGRLLRYVWIDGKLINQLLVEQGYAVISTFPPDVKYQHLFQAAESQARQMNVGLWSACPSKL